jgi:hypothetical protein
MADNVTLPGAGSSVETREQLGGSQRQVVVLGETESAALLSVLKNIAHPIWYDGTTGHLRVNVNNIASISAGSLTSVNTVNTVTSVNTVNTVTSLTNLNSRSTDQIFLDNMQTAWATSIRGQIT